MYRTVKHFLLSIAREKSRHKKHASKSCFTGADVLIHYATLWRTNFAGKMHSIGAKFQSFFPGGRCSRNVLVGCAGHGCSNSRTISEKLNIYVIFITLFQTLTTQNDTLFQWPTPL